MGNIVVDRSLCGGLFGKARQAVLALLYGHADVSYYTRQILDAAGTGRGAVQRELKNLTDAGIIVREVQGRQVYYRANEKCPIFAELKSIVRKTFGVAEVIREALAARSRDIRVAFIFGSVARAADDKRSDVDVMVVGELSFAETVALLSAAEEQLGREVTPVVYLVAEFRRRVREGHYFVMSVLEGEKIFLVGDEDELGRLAEPEAGRETSPVGGRDRQPASHL